MPNTATYGWPYPAPSAPNNVPLDMQAALEAVEATVLANMPTWRATTPIIGAGRGATDKLIMTSFSQAFTATSGGAISIGFPSGFVFPKGIAGFQVTCGDEANGMAQFIPRLSSSSLGAIFGLCYTRTGTLIASLPVRVNVFAIGW